MKFVILVMPSMPRDYIHSRTKLRPLNKLRHLQMSQSSNHWVWNHWVWKKEQEDAFKKTKQLLQSSKVLVHFDPDKELTVCCDASPYGIGAVLSHKMEDNTEQPIEFASHTLSPAERGYSQIEKEGLAIIFAVKKFHQYIYGRTVEIFTDHKPLTSLFHEAKGVPALASARIQRWSLTLNAYSYKLKFRSGKNNCTADALSRLPLPDMPACVSTPPDTVLLLEYLDSIPVTAKQIKVWTDHDPVLSRVRKYILHGWPDHKIKD